MHLLLGRVSFDVHCCLVAVFARRVSICMTPADVAESWVRLVTVWLTVSESLGEMNSVALAATLRHPSFLLFPVSRQIFVP
jgi:hypothetical protein